MVGTGKLYTREAGLLYGLAGVYGTEVCFTTLHLLFTFSDIVFLSS